MPRLVCPKCGSDAVITKTKDESPSEHYTRDVTYGRCVSCHHEWVIKDPGLEPT